MQFVSFTVVFSKKISGFPEIFLCKRRGKKAILTPFYENWPGESGNVPLLPGLFYFAEKINRANYG